MVSGVRDFRRACDAVWGSIRQSWGTDLFEAWPVAVAAAAAGEEERRGTRLGRCGSNTKAATTRARRKLRVTRGLARSPLPYPKFVCLVNIDNFIVFQGYSYWHQDKVVWEGINGIFISSYIKRKYTNRFSRPKALRGYLPLKFDDWWTKILINSEYHKVLLWFDIK